MLVYVVYENNVCFSVIDLPRLDSWVGCVRGGRTSQPAARGGRMGQPAGRGQAAIILGLFSTGSLPPAGRDQNTKTCESQREV